MKRRAITIDNGGSELRFISNTDNREVKILDNNMSIINPADFRVKDGVGELDIIKVIEAPAEEFKKMFATEVGYFMYNGSGIGFTSQTNKADSDAWYQKCIIAIARDAMGSLLENGEDIDGTTEFEYAAVPLIPLSEHSGSKDLVSKLKERLAGTYVIEFPILGEGKRVKINIAPERIGVLPEGAVVITSMRSEIEKDDYTIIVDMGNGTTDRAMFKGTQLVGSAITPSTFAGGTLLKLIGTEVTNHSVATTTDLEIQALNTNKITIRKNDIDMSEGVDRAKQTFISSYIKNEILTLIELSGIQASNVSRIIAIGGVLGLENPTTKKKDLLELIVKECNLTNADIVTIEGNPRHVNVQKAADFCDVLATKLGYEISTKPMPEEDEEKEELKIPSFMGETQEESTKEEEEPVSSEV